MEKKLQKIYLTYYNLLIAQDLWQAHYQILSIIFLKEFIELNVNSNTMKLVELNISIETKYTKFRDDPIKCKCLCCYQRKFYEKLKGRFFNT